MSAVSNGESVFITGSAGTGKTILVKRIIAILKKIHGRSSVYVTASTGIAACAIRGQTLHSFAGIGIHHIDRETMLHSILMDKRALYRWNKAKALVVDEISMVDAELYENLEYIARNARGIDKVWGGLQLIASGDFFQLPPIIGQRVSSSGKEFAFEADCWNSSFNFQGELTRVFRQTDEEFVKLLQGIRRGESNVKELEFLEHSCLVSEQNPAVQLYPLNEEVRKVNEERLMSLKKDIVTYTALDSGKVPWIRQLNQGISQKEIKLCEGARVMLIKNLNPWKGLVNGATGTVIGFDKRSKNSIVGQLTLNRVLPLVRFDSGEVIMVEPDEWDVVEGDKVVACRKQVPLILAWALSIHKSQGMTIDRLQTNLSRAFVYGMVYVCLSRVRSLEGLCLSGFCASKIKAHPKVLEFYTRFASEGGKKEEDGEDENEKENEWSSPIREKEMEMGYHSVTKLP